MSVGENVKTRQGLTTLKDKQHLAGTHRVYNLEVYRDHNYMVSMDSILVHNKNVEGVGKVNNFGKNNPNYSAELNAKINAKTGINIADQKNGPLVVNAPNRSRADRISRLNKEDPDHKGKLSSIGEAHTATDLEPFVGTMRRNTKTEGNIDFIILDGS